MQFQETIWRESAAGDSDCHGSNLSGAQSDVEAHRKHSVHTLATSFSAVEKYANHCDLVGLGGEEAHP